MSYYVTITATSIQDATGALLASGYLSFQATDQTGAPINFRCGISGQTINTPVSTPITAGAIGTFQVADPWQAAPSGFYYRITVLDPNGKPVVEYTLVTITSGSWSFDSYIPSMMVIPPIGGTINGPIAFTGEVTVIPPVNPTDAATKGYVDTGLATKVNTTTTVNGHALSSNVVVSASDITTGTLPHAQLPALLSTDIPNLAESQVTNLTTDLAGKVPTSTTVNGHPLSSNVTVSASDLTTGTLPHAQLPALLSGDIPNNAANTSGTAAGLSTNIAESQVTNLPTDLSSRVVTSTTVNGHALSSNVVITASDLTTGTLPHAQLPALVSGDIPANAANTSGTAANVSGTPALPSGTMATTQAANDNTTKIATDAFVIGQAATAAPAMNGTVAVGTGTTFARADHVHASDTSRVATSTTVNGHALSLNVTVSASDLTTGTLPHAQLPTLLSGDIPANAANTSGTAAGLSANIAESQVTNLTTDLGSKVSTSVTVNGHALSSNVVISASDLTTGNLPIAQIPTGGSSSTYLRGDGSWVTPTGSGNVVAPASSVVGDYAIYNNTTGTLLADGGQPTFRNRIINGDMKIDQRNAGGLVYPVTNAQYLLDRWRGLTGQANKYSMQQSTDAPTATGFTNSVKLAVVNAYTSGSSAGDYFVYQQALEGLNISDLGFGAAGAQAVTLSFWVKNSVTGTYSVSLVNGATNRTYVANYTVSSANTWQKVSLPISGDTTGTWATDNTTGMWVNFDLGSGSVFQTTAGSWSGSYMFTTSGATKWLSNSGAYLWITGVQLEAGSVATPFERVDYGTALVRCQRYYQSSAADVYPVGVVWSTTGGSYYAFVPLFVTMRTSPTVTLGDGGTSYWGYFQTSTQTYQYASAPTASNIMLNSFTVSGTSTNLSTNQALVLRGTWWAVAEI